MADINGLGQVLGSMMSALVEARKIADLETAALAEFYKENPLLEGMSLPRVRVPEMTIDMPVILEQQVGGEAGEYHEPKTVTTALAKKIQTLGKDEGVTMNAAFVKSLQTELNTNLISLNTRSTRTKSLVSKEAVARSSEEALTLALKKANIQLTPNQRRVFSQEIRNEALRVGVKKEGMAATVITNIRTADVKERATPDNVARIKLTIKEEGLEWVKGESGSGEIQQTLQPE